MEEQNGNIGDPGNLLSIIEQAGSPTAPQSIATDPPADIIEGVSREKFIEALTTVTGGAVKDPSEITTLVAGRQQMTEYQKRIHELEAKTAVSPFAGPLVEKINELARNGASKIEMQRFLQYQDIDPTSMSDMDAYRKSLEYQHPGLSAAEITALVDEKFDPDQVAANNPLVTAKIKVEAASARTFLQNLKVQSETPASVAERQTQQARQQQFTAGWKQVVDKSAGSMKTEITKQFDGVSAPYTYSHQYSPEALELAKQDAMAWAVGNQIPFTEDGLRKVQQVMEQQAAAYDREKMVTALIEDVWQSAIMVMLKKTAGAPPPPLPATNTPNPGSTAQKPTRPDPKSLVS